MLNYDLTREIVLREYGELFGLEPAEETKDESDEGESSEE